MDIKYYRQFVEEYVREAYQNSDGTNLAVSEYLSTLKEPGRFTPHRQEKTIALVDVRKAFSDHRHWPPAIVLSHLGIEDKELIARVRSK